MLILVSSIVLVALASTIPCAMINSPFSRKEEQEDLQIQCKAYEHLKNNSDHTL